MVLRPITLITCLLVPPCFATPTMFELSRQGTHLRLIGDFERAAEIESTLIADAGNPIGHIFALNTIVTHLTWDETRVEYDDALIAHAQKVLAWCEPRHGNSALAGFYCGQATFALSFHHALKGRYIRAGRLGSQTIEYLEAALEIDPAMIDAKMHLGVAYYIADNLPPFVRLFSRFLWFIPSGNSDKSLPYLLDVMERGDEYPDVARYIYSTLLLDDDEQRYRAREQLQILVDRYPRNARFQLRLISLLLMEGDFDETLATAERYLESGPVEPDLSLARVWMVRACLGLNRPDEARHLFAQIDPMFRYGRQDLPGWSIAWHMLTDGQLNDLAGHRREARESYAEIIAMAGSTYVNQAILDAARSGLLAPYRLKQ